MMIALDGVAKRFGGVLALNDVTVGFERSAVSAIVGPNGSGKTTLLNVISGFCRPDRGNVMLDGKVDLLRLAPYRRARLGIGRTFQEPRPFLDLSVLDNVLAALDRDAVQGSGSVKAAVSDTTGLPQDTDGVLRLTDLDSEMAKPAAELSFGKRKLLDLARALVLNPKCLLLDEPFAGVDPRNCQTVISVVERLRAAGRAVVMISHEIDIVLSLADRVFLMDEGKLATSGSPDEVRADRLFTDTFLGVAVA
jgi:ABC-type branched-subunit amino acid transport system ATPase component